MTRKLNIENTRGTNTPIALSPLQLLRRQRILPEQTITVMNHLIKVADSLTQKSSSSKSFIVTARYNRCSCRNEHPTTPALPMTYKTANPIVASYENPIMLQRKPHTLTSSSPFHQRHRECPCVVPQLSVK